MTIGGANKLFWRPNNYRRRITLSKVLNSIGKTAIASTLGLQLEKHSQLLFIKDFFPNITLMVGKFKVTAIWSQNVVAGEKEVFMLEGDDFRAIERFINSKKFAIEESLDRSLAVFLSRFKLLTNSSPVWVWHEDFLRGDDYIDKIPAEVVIHSKVFKKVYDKGIEAVGGLGVEPTISIKNFIKNRMREEFRLDYNCVDEWARDNIFCLEDVNQFESYIKCMSFGNRLFLSDWLFERFGGLV